MTYLLALVFLFSTSAMAAEPRDPVSPPPKAQTLQFTPATETAQATLCLTCAPVRAECGLQCSVMTEGKGCGMPHWQNGRPVYVTFCTTISNGKSCDCGCY